MQKKCREGTSLRKLELLLEAYGLKAKKDTIQKHISICMDIQVSQQRTVEKETKRKGIKKLGQKLTGFFIPKREEPPFPKSCPHTQTISFFDLRSERVLTKCKMCGKLLTGSVDPHKKLKNRRRDLIIYGSLRK
jgi:hypothetical protein